jgi:nitrite reductase/ring-hydroxylating ferredoxin subunit
MFTEFTFDPHLATAATPPAEWYTDPSMLEREQRAIFRRTWQYACSLDLLRLPGNFAAVDVAGTPVVLTRGADGELNAFHNVCRHRAGVVARGCGNRKTLQCAYHGWRYGVDGRCTAIPQLDDPTRVPAKARVAFLDRAGRKQEKELEGIWSTLVQHEIDHLNGVLFIDYLSRLKRDMVVRKFTKQKRAEAL